MAFKVSMPRLIPEYGYGCQPHLVKESKYSGRMTTRALLSRNLKAIRRHRGLNQDQLAPVPQTTISRIERGENATDIDTLTDVANALGVDVWILLAPELDPANMPVKALSQSDAEKNEELRAAAKRIANLQ